jgi:hypothetical protein
MDFNIIPAADCLSRKITTLAITRPAGLNTIALAASALEAGCHIRKKDAEKTAGVIGGVFGAAAANLVTEAIIIGMGTGPAGVILLIVVDSVVPVIGQWAGKHFLTGITTQAMGLTDKKPKAAAPTSLKIDAPKRPQPITFAKIKRRALDRAHAAKALQAEP